ncbi:MAG: site-specific integrase [Oscillospiraceae bacterium]|nr:site-specific integrase [Oscillospiraceae bacterium]
MSGQYAAVTPVSRYQERPLDGLHITPHLIDEFLSCLQQKGYTPDTLYTYRRSLELLYGSLPESKQLRRGTLEQWQSALLAEGYAARTVNVCVSAANSLLEYAGRRDLQVKKPLAPGGQLQPELTRTEYLRLLSTARILGKERTYLLIKLFGAVGLTVQELTQVTVEAVQAGRLSLSAGRFAHIPESLRTELLEYAKREGITSGLIFTSGDGRVLHRSNISGSIRALCRDAQVAEEKGNPRCLRKLYQTTQARIVSNISVVVEQAYDRLLETEQLAIGWNHGG